MTHTPTLRPAWKKLTAISAASLIALSMANTAAAEDFKIGIVSFLSGQAADSFGVPAVNGAKTLVEAFNNGKVPAPYNKKGFGGMNIVPVYVDENGGATKQVQELRNLYDREKVDAVVGYVGSGDCLAVAPVAEEMKKFLILAALLGTAFIVRLRTAPEPPIVGTAPPSTSTSIRPALMVTSP